MTIKEMNTPFDIGMALLIKKSGLKQAAIAGKIGCIAQELSDMLNGRRLIKACDISKIATVLNCGIDEIYAAGSMNERG